jgi:ATP-dependent Lon protease
MTRLPLFPLALALFPGTQQLLHIFEPRYRKLLDDCLEGDKRFGLLCVNESSQTGNATPEPGDVGCSAAIQSHLQLPDGRSNILVRGEDRFLLKDLVESDAPYFTAVVDEFRDDPEDDPILRDLSRQVRKLLAALRAAQGSPVSPADESGYSDDPSELSFQLAAEINVGLPVKEEFLRLTSARARLQRLREVLREQTARAVADARVREMSRRNGRGDHRPEIG